MKNRNSNRKRLMHNQAGFTYALKLIGGKYKMPLLYQLASQDVMRFNELKRAIPAISFKTLSLSLKELEQDELIIRTAYSEIPPKVEYQLSKKGQTLIPVLNVLCDWGEAHQLSHKKRPT